MFEKLPSPKYFLQLFALLCLFSCKSQKTDLTQDSTSSQTTIVDTNHQTAVRVDSNQLHRDTTNLNLPGVQSAAFEEPDVEAPVHFKYVSKTETSKPGIEFFVVNVEQMNGMTVVHGILQNRWGKGTKIHPEPLRVTVSAERFTKTKLLDDESGKLYYTNPNLGKGKMTVTTSLETSLKPSEQKVIVMTFDALPSGSHSATLTIPGFVTVPGLALDNSNP